MKNRGESNPTNNPDSRINTLTGVTKAAVILAGAAALASCASPGNAEPTTAPKPETTKTAEASLTCEQYADTIRIQFPDVDSPEGQAWLQEHRIPASTPAAEVLPAQADLYFELLNVATKAALPEDRKTLEDCAYTVGISPEEIGEGMALNNITNLYTAAMGGSTPGPDWAAAEESAKTLVNTVAQVELGGAANYPNGQVLEITETDPSARIVETVYVSDTQVIGDWKSQFTLSNNEVHDFQFGGNYQLNPATQTWDWIGKGQ